MGVNVMNPWNRRQFLFYLGLSVTGATHALNLDNPTDAQMVKSSHPIGDRTNHPAPFAIAAQKTLPEFQGISHWFNSQPLTVAQLKGKVVLVQFWTFSCINCQRTLPHIVKWHQTYAAKGLQVIGVHTPEFAYERELKNIQQSLQRYKITYPVPVDNGFKTWQAYDNHYWPHLFLADRQGVLRYDHIGEEAYDTTEQMIQKFLG
jgi:thiol-disulfide isomerase/thioredoxin